MDMTDKYNTKLSPKEESKYQEWLKRMSKTIGRDMSKDTYDYDMRGAFKAGVKPSANAHFTDKFKKPNHPTFSTESKYHGVDGHKGGTWVQDKKGQWNYEASSDNIKNVGRKNLEHYFKTREKDVKLKMPSLTVNRQDILYK